MRNDRGSSDVEGLIVISLLVVVVLWCAGMGWLIRDGAYDYPTIADERVPRSLECAEDEFIGYDVSTAIGPRPMTCVHYDAIRGEK